MNYYDELEVSTSASTEVIKAAYKAQAKKYHPDVYRGDPRFASEKLVNLNRAYDVLTNIQKREEYNYLNKIKTESNNNRPNETKYQSYTNSNPNQTSESDIQDDHEDDSDEYYYEEVEYLDDDEFNRKVLSPILIICFLLFISFIIYLILDSQLAS